MKKSVKSLVKTIGATVALLPSIALAATVTPPSIIPSASASVDPYAFVLKMFNYVLGFVGFVALGFLVWGGVQFMTSGGDESKVGKARNTILYAVIGIIVVVLSIAIINWVKGFFG